MKRWSTQWKHFWKGAYLSWPEGNMFFFRCHGHDDRNFLHWRDVWLCSYSNCCRAVLWVQTALNGWYLKHFLVSKLAHHSLFFKITYTVQTRNKHLKKPMWKEHKKIAQNTLSSNIISVYELDHCLFIVLVLVLVSAQDNSYVNSKVFDEIKTSVSKWNALASASCLISDNWELLSLPAASENNIMRGINVFLWLKRKTGPFSIERHHFWQWKSTISRLTEMQSKCLEMQ